MQPCELTVAQNWKQWEVFFFIFLLFFLTLNCVRYPALPIVHKGFHETSLKKATFQLQLECHYFYTAYNIYIKYNHIPVKKLKIFVQFQNGTQITYSSIASFDFGENLKTTTKKKKTFPKEYFIENLLKIWHYEYIVLEISIPVWF